MRPIDLQSAAAVRDALFAGAAANRSAACRVGSIDRIEPPGTLIATGDLHDNPINFAKLVAVAGMDGGRDEGGRHEGTKGRRHEGEETEASKADSVLPSHHASLPPPPSLRASVPDPSPPSSLPHSVPPPLRPSVPSSPPSHLVLHEIIHSDRLINGMDFSYRALARVAALKAEYPERVHALLANHELAQVFGAGIIKDGVKVVDAFNDGVEYVFGDDAPAVQEAVKAFILSMPLALRCVSSSEGRGGDILVAHSLPSTAMMDRFDPTVLSRDLTPEDYEPRRGAAHIMVWGRGYDAEQLEDLVERWGVNLFILGHEKAENGVKLIPPCAIVLNSDHDRGVYLPIDLSRPPRAEEAAWMAVPLASVPEPHS